MSDAREVLLRHARNPARHGPLPLADARGSCRNPLCGDHVEVALKVNSEGSVIEDIRILVSGCAIATASASLMTELVLNLKCHDLLPLIASATATISSTTDAPWPESLGRLRALESLRRNPRKIPCALMAWYALKDAIKVDVGAEKWTVSKNETTL